MLGVLSSGVKWPGREVNHPSPPSAEISTSGAVPLVLFACLHTVPSESVTFLLFVNDFEIVR